MDKNRSVSDLAWAINSNPLIAGTPGNTKDHADLAGTGLLPLEPFRVDPEYVDPEHLEEFLAAHQTGRVGRYFELLVLYWLQHIRQVEILAHSLPIRDGKRTLGEIDILFRDELDRLTHWELAVKFYLYLPGSNAGHSRFIGPNAADTLEQKLHRLFGHQLPLSVGRFQDVKVREAFMKGRLFYHPCLALPHRFNRPLSSDHLRGSWIRCSELDLLESTKDIFYRVLYKPFWLGEEKFHQVGEEVLMTDEICCFLEKHFSRSQHSVLLCKFRHGSESTREVDRVFVVSDRWPAV